MHLNNTLKPERSLWNLSHFSGKSRWINKALLLVAETPPSLCDLLLPWVRSWSLCRPSPNKHWPSAPTCKELHEIRKGRGELWIKASPLRAAERLHPLHSALLSLSSPLSLAAALSLRSVSERRYLVGGTKERLCNKNSCLWWSRCNWDC